MNGRAVAIAVDGARLHGEWCAEPVAGRPALVFLHDGLGSVETWRGLPARLGRRLGTGAFAYDRRGYGRSDGRALFPVDFIEQEAARLPESSASPASGTTPRSATATAARSPCSTRPGTRPG